MNLLRISERTINMDQVVEIQIAEHDTPWVDVRTTAVQTIDPGYPGYYEFRLHGEEARVLLDWLDASAANLTPQTQEDVEWNEYRRKGGDMARPEWEEARRHLHGVLENLEGLNGDSPSWDRLMSRASELERRLVY